MNYYYQKISSEVGPLTIVAHDKALVAILWEKEKLNRVKLPALKEDTDHPLIKETIRQLTEYFESERWSFDLPLDLQGTPFQKEVWKALKEIPYGCSSSYAQIAKSLRRPQSARAIGCAVGKNPLSIVIPCHRVIGSNGQLTGFAGGLPAKTFLLNLEGCIITKKCKGQAKRNPSA